MRGAEAKPGSITQYILEQGLSFMPLDELERLDPMPLNPKCGKAKNGTTFDAPHDAPRLADLLRNGGHFVPEPKTLPVSDVEMEQHDDIQKTLFDME